MEREAIARRRAAVAAEHGGPDEFFIKAAALALAVTVLLKFAVFAALIL